MARNRQGLPLLALASHLTRHQVPLHQHPINHTRRLRRRVREHLDRKLPRGSRIRRTQHWQLPPREPRYTNTAEHLRHQMRPRGEPMVCHHGRRSHLPHTRQAAKALYRKTECLQYPRGQQPAQQLCGKTGLLQRLLQALRRYQRGTLLSRLEEEQLDLHLRQERDKPRLLLTLYTDRP